MFFQKIAKIVQIGLGRLAKHCYKPVHTTGHGDAPPR
ncbi:hypothetical protein FHS63_004507 [Azospirillum doebereinerae]